METALLTILTSSDLKQAAEVLASELAFSFDDLAIHLRRRRSQSETVQGSKKEEAEGGKSKIAKPHPGHPL